MTLPPSVLAEVRLHVTRHGGTDYVFTTPNHELRHVEEWRANVWRPAVAAAGLAPLRPHDLKHTGAALLAAAGVDQMEIARRVGHSSVAFTLDRYGHLFPAADTMAATKLGGVRLARRPSFGCSVVLSRCCATSGRLVRHSGWREWMDI